MVWFDTFCVFKNVIEICRFGKEKEKSKIKSQNVSYG